MQAEGFSRPALNMTFISRDEFDRGNKTKDFPLFSKDSWFTDDTVMTIAVAEALLDTIPFDRIKALVEVSQG